MKRKNEKTLKMKGNTKAVKNHLRSEVGLSEDIRVVHSGEPNPNDGQ